MDRMRAAVARRLEAGVHDGALATAASRAWGAVASARLARPLSWSFAQTRCDERLHVIAVGGSTLGGSGKTPVAIACAAALAETLGRVVLVGHAYRATPGRARIVSPDDDVRVVGDEALLAARAFAASGSAARVVVAPTRQEAIDRARAEASILVLDGVLQTAPLPAARSILALDAESPWGAGHCPPRGDLRAPIARLLAAADLVVTLRDPDAPASGGVLDATALDARPLHEARVVSRGARLGDLRVSWPDLASMRIGLVTTLARPSRITAFLARRGVRPVASRAFADHGTAPRAWWSAAASARVDLWLTTAKCALRLPPPRESGAPVAILDHRVLLPSALARALHPTLCACAAHVHVDGDADSRARGDAHAREAVGGDAWPSARRA